MYAGMTSSEITNKDLYDLIKNTQKIQEETKQELISHKIQINYAITGIKEDLLTELRTLKEENTQPKEENKKLKEKLSKVEKNQNKYSVILYNIPEIGNDLQGILEVIRSYFKVEIQSNEIRDCFRIGKITTKPRPLIVEFVSYNSKQLLLRKSADLKGANISISNYFTLEEYTQRNILYNNFKIAN